MLNIQSDATNSTRYSLLISNNGGIIYKNSESQLITVDDYSKFTIDLDANAQYLYISCLSSAVVSVKIRKKKGNSNNYNIANNIYSAALSSNLESINFNAGQAVVNNNVSGYNNIDLEKHTGFTLYPGTDYYIIKFQYSEPLMYLLEATSSFDLSRFVMYSDGEIISPLLISDTEYKWLISEESIGERDGIEFRFDNRGGINPITIDYIAAYCVYDTNNSNITITESNIDLNYIFRNSAKKDLSATTNISLSTLNQDGTITVGAGGFYFPAIAVHGYFNGDCYIRITIKDYMYDTLNAANTSALSGGGYNYYPFTLLSIDTTTNEKTWYLCITDDDYDKENDYKNYILRIDNRANSNDIIIKSIEIVDSGIPSITNSTSSNSIAYVSTTGNDNNGTGTVASPFASVTKALQSGANYILVNPGTYHENINVSLASGKITILNNGTYNLCKFLPADESAYILSKTETKVDGYNKVYKTSSTRTVTQNYLFQNGVDDLSTEILDTERLPYQRGMKYRCENTKLQKCTQTELSAALAEIEACTDNVYKFFQDAETLDIYFCRPQEISETNYLAFPGSTQLFNGLSKKISLEVIGIECMYMTFSVAEAAKCKIVDCKAGYNQSGGAFVYSRQVGTEFIRCEAVRCVSGSNGDGFNGHSTNSGDIYSKQTTVSLIDCWSHDNQDDGYSDHERSEITIQGGLYEWNGKGGIVPSYGSHCTCYNVYSRNNYAGFNYVGPAAEDEGGMYGQMICFYCHSENNNRGGKKAGFAIDGDGNRMELIGCTSIGNNVGYTCSTNNIVRMIDCKSLNDTVIKYFPNTATIGIVNTSLVTEN